MSRPSDRSSILVAIVLVVVSTALGAQAGSSEELTYDEAVRRAREGEVPLVVDFFTEWCGPCKVFDRDRADAGSGIAEALEAAVFVAVDAEKGEGVALAERFHARSYPTFVVLDPTGEMVTRWMGYAGPKHFVEQLETALGEMITVDERRARFASEPNAADARSLAALALGNGHHREAIGLYREAEALEPAVDHSPDLVFAGYMAVKNDADFGLREFARLLEQEIDENSPPFLWMSGFDVLCQVAGARNDGGLRGDYVRRARTVIDEGERFAAIREEFDVLALLHVDNDPARAIERKQASLGDDWSENPEAVVSYSWWCYKNRVDMEHASALARRAVERATSAALKAQLLYTASRVEQARGDGPEALRLARRAVDAEPANAHYRALVDELRSETNGQGN